jgi:acylphosphatase
MPYHTISKQNKKGFRLTKTKAEIIVKGAVQKTGYRDYVQEKARSLNVKGYVENLRDGSVRIVCEADEETLKNFNKLINIKQDLIAVEEIETIKKQPATGEYEYFDIKYGSMEEEMGERMVAGLKMTNATRQEIKGTRAEIRDMHQDLKGSIVSMHQDVNQNFKEMAERYDVISAELLKTRKELEIAVDNLVKVIQKFLEKST